MRRFADSPEATPILERTNDLGKHLHGFDHAKARQIFRRFLDTNAKVNVSPDGVLVRLPRRAHNPLLLDSGLLAAPIAVPRWGGASLKVEIP